MCTMDTVATSSMMPLGEYHFGRIWINLGGTFVGVKLAAWASMKAATSLAETLSSSSPVLLAMSTSRLIGTPLRCAKKAKCARRIVFFAFVTIR